MSKLIDKCNNETSLRMPTILMEISYQSEKVLQRTNDRN